MGLLLLERHPRLVSPNCLKAPASSDYVETAHAHVCHICHAGEPESNHDDEIAEKKNGALEVIALALTVHVAEKKYAQDDSDHVPLRENEAESVVDEVILTKPLSIDGAE